LIVSGRVAPGKDAGPGNDPVDIAIEVIRNGEVVGLPTDTVYGIGADPHDPRAIGKLFSIKGRGIGNPIGLLVANLTAAAELISIPPYAIEWAERHWPGPLNLVGRPLVEVGVGTADSLAVRVPAHETALALLAAFGPLAVTSANRAGGPETRSDLEARAVLGEAVALYLPGSCPGGQASTTVDVRGETPVVLRQGPIELDLEAS
jgi:tRNA threonylcarbamoyl adenosine modification protein (Sua5/YciO/YrdC/YwlC family)